MGDVREVESLFARCSRMMMTITTLPQPVIARVHGIATAAGCQLVATCDLAVASDGGDLRHAGREHRRVLFHARRRARPGGRPQARHGDAAHRRDDRRRACLRDRTRQSRRAARGARCRGRDAWRDCIASKSSAAIASGKQVFYRQLELSLGDAYGVAGHAIACDFFTEDGKEGVDAFLGKRAPRWKNRQ